MGESEDGILNTTGGTFPLREYRLRRGGREWTVWHAGAVLTGADEALAIASRTNRLPYRLTSPGAVEHPLCPSLTVPAGPRPLGLAVAARSTQARSRREDRAMTIELAQIRASGTIRSPVRSDSSPGSAVVSRRLDFLYTLGPLVFAWPDCLAMM